MLRRFLAILILLSGSLVHGQNMESKFTYNVELGLPSTIANRPFSDIMQGLANCSMYAQYNTPFELNAGIGIRYSLLTIYQFAVTENINGANHIGTIFAKLGWERFHTERFATDLSIRAGVSRNYFLTNFNKESGDAPVFRESMYVEPNLGLVLTVDDWNSYRLHIGYAIHGYGFKPQMLGLQSNLGYDTQEYHKLTQYLVVGFGYTYYFNNKKKPE